MVEYEVQPYGDLIRFTRSRKEWAAAVQADSYANSGDELGHLDADGICWWSPNGYVVGVFNGKPGTLAHELSHACLTMLDRRGIDVQEANQEPFCYLLGHLITYFTGKR